jgi:hypothetical protein
VREGLEGGSVQQQPRRLPRRLAITAADLISALATGTHWDITATDQIRPIATTTVPVRICMSSASR